VIGDVGSGKTSLLSSIIGDLRYLNKPFVESNIQRKIEKDFIFLNEIDKESLKEISGAEKPIVINENIAYVQQNPWIQNKTIRENILFGS